MDYVLFGMGYGASLMLMGWALRTFGPGLKYQTPEDENVPAGLLARRMFWSRFVQGLGGVLAVAGLALVVLTFAVMMVNPTDHDGAVMALVAWGLILLGVLIWSWLYWQRFGLTGVWTREEGYGLLGRRRQDEPPQDARAVARRARAQRAIAVTDRSGHEADAHEDVSDDAVAEIDEDVDRTGETDGATDDEPARDDDDDIEGDTDDDEDNEAIAVAAGNDDIADDGADDDDDASDDANADDLPLTDVDEYDFGDGTRVTVPVEQDGREVREGREDPSRRAESPGVSER